MKTLHLKALVLCAAISISCGTAHAQSANVNVIQNHVANVYASVQVGNNRSVSVRQAGATNMVGVVQAGNGLSATVSQTGATNSASVTQIGVAPVTRSSVNSMINALRPGR